MGAYRPCRGCGRPVSTEIEKPSCRGCLREARMRTCQWCGADFDHKKNNKAVACCPSHGANYAHLNRFGWSLAAVKRLVADTAPELLGIES